MTATAQTSVRHHLVHFLMHWFFFCFHIFYEFILSQTSTLFLGPPSASSAHRVFWLERIGRVYLTPPMHPYPPVRDLPSIDTVWTSRSRDGYGVTLVVDEYPIPWFLKVCARLSPSQRR